MGKIREKGIIDFSTHKSQTDEHLDFASKQDRQDRGRTVLILCPEFNDNYKWKEEKENQKNK